MSGLTTNRLLTSPSTRRSFVERSTWTACCKNDGCVAAVTWAERVREKSKQTTTWCPTPNRKRTHIQKDAIRKSHFYCAALVYLKLADHTIDVCWRLLLVHVLGRGRGRGCRRFGICRKRDAFDFAGPHDIDFFAWSGMRRCWGDERGEGYGELEKVQALLFQALILCKYTSVHMRVQ